MIKLCSENLLNLAQLRMLDVGEEPQGDDIGQSQGQ